MSEALAGSSTTLARPGTQRGGRPRPIPKARPTQLGTRYLAFIAAAAVVLGLSFKSELLTPSQVWFATAGLCASVTVGIFFLHSPTPPPACLTLVSNIPPTLPV